MEFSTVLRRLSTNIKHARWLAGLTQEEASGRTGLTYRYYQEVERGTRNPTLRVLFEIATTLGVSIADLTDVEPSRRRTIPLADLRPTPPRSGRKPTVRSKNR